MSGYARNVSTRSDTSFTGVSGVDWTSEYKRERRATWEDIANAIHDSVTMDEVLSMYTPSTPKKHRRCPCPIHQGKDYNFSYTEQGYKCFVCGASGDVITFVQTVCELATRTDAMKRINADFRLSLPIGCEITPAEDKALRKRREAAREKERIHEEWERGLQKLWDEWCRLDRNRIFCAPDSPAWIEAVKNIDRVAYEIDCYPEEPR